VSGSSPADALGDYRRYRERQGANYTVDPPAAAPVPEDPLAAQKASERAAIALRTPAGREAEAARLAAIAAANPRPAPRETLRVAHQQKAEAQQEAQRLQQALDRAKEHLAEVAATRDAAKRDLEAVEAEHAAKLLEELTNGAAGRVEPIAGEKRVLLAEAEHQVEIAARAAEKLGAEYATAQTRLSTAEAKITAAVCAVLLDEGERQAVEILQAAVLART
jgi:hypothetical protein